MATIQNLTKQVVLLRLNSGAEINVAPGTKLERVEHSELRNNPSISKLEGLCMIKISTATAKPAEPEPLRIHESEDAEAAAKAKADQKTAR